MNQHKKFIMTPISNILQQAILATNNIGNGIETFPLADYILQSVFIKMTGAQEQKMKCLMWEIAHNDFEFRYKFLQKAHGEYSNYEDKQKVYNSLIKQILIVDKNFLIKDKIDKLNILAASKLEKLLKNSNLIIWSEKGFINYKKLWSEIQFKHFANQNNALLETTLTDNGKMSLRNLYEEHLYKNRNRIAHNTKSYQHNLPTLNSLKNENFIFENYFLWFSTLILIDHIFMAVSYTHLTLPTILRV